MVTYRKGFGPDVMKFCCSLIKDFKRRPKYRKLLDHPFIVRYELLHVDVGAWVKQVLPRLVLPPAFQVDLLSPLSKLPPLPVKTPSPQSAPQTPQKSWFVKQASKSIFRSAANVPSTAPLPRKQYNIVNY